MSFQREQRLNSFCSTMSSDEEAEGVEAVCPRMLSRRNSGRVLAAVDVVRTAGRVKKGRYVDQQMEEVTTMRSAPMASFMTKKWRLGEWPLVVTSISEQKIIDLLGTEDDLASDLDKMQVLTQHEAYHFSPLITHHPPLITHHSPPITHHSSLLTTHYSLITHH